MKFSPTYSMEKLLVSKDHEIDNLRSALQVIHTWATFEGGVALDPENVANLCRKTLKIS